MIFTGRIEYDDRVTLKLAKMQQHIFNASVKITGYILSVFLAGAGFYLGINTTAGLLFLITGCLLVTNIDSGIRHKVKRLRTALNGYVPVMEYTFDADCLVGRTEKEKSRCNYNKLIRIVYDGEFYYLFPDKQSCYMVSEASIKPEDSKKFRKMLEDGSGLKITVPFSFLKNGIYTLIVNKLNTRKQTDKR